MYFISIAFEKKYFIVLMHTKSPEEYITNYNRSCFEVEEEKIVVKQSITSKKNLKAMRQKY